MNKIFCFLSLIISCSIGMSQNVFEVNTSVLNGVNNVTGTGANGSLNNMLAAAENYLVANPGAMAYVLFNIPNNAANNNGMVDASQSNLSINQVEVNQGQLIIEKSPSAPPIQGVLGNGSWWNLKIGNAALAGKISIQNLRFDGLGELRVMSRKLYSASKTFVTDISYNEFWNCNTAIAFDISINTLNATDYYAVTDRVSIIGNSIIDCENGIDVLRFSSNSPLTLPAVSYSSEDFLIQGNVIQRSGASATGIGIQLNHTSLGAHGLNFNYNGIFRIDNNEIDNYDIGVRLRNFDSSWPITTNTIHNSNNGFLCEYSSPALDNYIFFVDQDNAYGVPPKNQDNGFVNCGITVNNSYDYRAVLLGNDLSANNGKQVDGYYHSNSMVTSIVSNWEINNSANYQANSSAPFVPITDFYPWVMTSISFNSAIVNGTNIDVDLTVDLNNSFVNNAQYFRLEYFLVSNDNSLVELIGSHIISNPTNSSNNYTHTLSNINGTAGRIGVTITKITGIGQVSIADDLEGQTTGVIYIDLECDNCSSFSPAPDHKYWLSAWVNVDYGVQKITYERPVITQSPSIELEMVGLNNSVLFYPTGDIIDGWQRIVGSFDMPVGIDALGIELNGDIQQDTYFDDIRIHPFNGSMKSYVYDPETFLLTAELDDNNYATFYEYDNEGGLVRIKKETSRGVVTIQETRSNSVKKP